MNKPQMPNLEKEGFIGFCFTKSLNRIRLITYLFIPFWIFKDMVGLF
jgi:hypothetical protein